MFNSITQFFNDLKESSKYLWYVIRFLIYLLFIYISFQLMSIASTIGNTLGFLLICLIAIVGGIRTIRSIKKLLEKL